MTVGSRVGWMSTGKTKNRVQKGLKRESLELVSKKFNKETEKRRV